MTRCRTVSGLLALHVAIVAMVVTTVGHSNAREEALAPSKHPEKIAAILRKLHTIQVAQSPEAVMKQLGIGKDSSVTGLKGSGGAGLGETWQGYDLGVNDEWVLHIESTVPRKNDGWDWDHLEVFEVRVLRGSIEQFKKEDGDVQWEVIYPFWKNGKVVPKPPADQQ